MDHTNWYKQRYSSSNSQAQAKKQEAIAAQREEWAALSEAQKERKQNNKKNAELVFQEHQIPYEVKTNLWTCTLFGKEYIFYPTTNKWKPKGGKTTYYSRGALDFIGKVAAYEERQKCN